MEPFRIIVGIYYDNWHVHGENYTHTMESIPLSQYLLESDPKKEELLGSDCIKLPECNTKKIHIINCILIDKMVVSVYEYNCKQPCNKVHTFWIRSVSSKGLL